MARIREMGFRPIEFMEYFAPDSTRYKFDTHSKFLMSEEGFGMPPINYISQQAPLQHGVTIYDYRLQQRIIQLVMRANGCNRDEYWSIRAQLLDAIRPNRQFTGLFELGTLRKIFRDGDKRDIHVMVEQGPSFAPGGRGWDEYGITDTIRFIAPDPTFFDPEIVEVSWETEVSDHLIFPFTFDGTDMIFTDDVDSIAFSITYTGTWISYPTIILRGPISGPVITNATTGKVIDLSTYDIVGGEEVTITLEFGNKTVTSSVSGNIIGDVASTSDLATFGIVPDPSAPDGVNDITVEGDDIVPGQSNVIIRYYTRYIGI